MLQSVAQQEAAQGKLRHFFVKDHVYQHAFTPEDEYLAFKHRVPKIFILDFELSDSSLDSDGNDSGDDSESDW